MGEPVAVAGLKHILAPTKVCFFRAVFFFAVPICR